MERVMEETLPVIADDGQDLAVATPEQIRGRIVTLKQAIDNNYMELGKLLYMANNRKLYLDWGHSTFKAYCEVELRLKERKALYLASIWKTLKVTVGVPDEKVEGIEWSKLKEITSVMDDKNADELIEAAKTETQQEIINRVKKERVRKQAKSEGKSDEEAHAAAETVETTQKVTFALYQDQIGTIETALEVAERVSGSDKKGHQLHCIALEYIANHLEGQPSARLNALVSAIEREFKVTLVLVRDPKAAAELKEAIGLGSDA